MSCGESVRAPTAGNLLPVHARQLENGSWVLESKLKPVDRGKPGPLSSKKGFYAMAYSKPMVKIPSRAELQDDSRPPEWWPRGVPVPKFNARHSGLTSLRRETVRAFLFQQKDNPLRFGKPGGQKWLEAVMDVLKDKKTGHGVKELDILYWIRYNYELGAVFRHVYVPRKEPNFIHKNSTFKDKGSSTKETPAPARVPPRNCEPQPGPSRFCMPYIMVTNETPVVPPAPMEKRQAEMQKKAEETEPSSGQNPGPPPANPDLPEPPAYSGVNPLASFSVEATRLENGNLTLRLPHAISKGSFVLIKPSSWITRAFPPDKVAPICAGQGMLQEESKSGPQQDGDREDQV